jgi:hypothetical protein
MAGCACVKGSNIVGLKCALASRLVLTDNKKICYITLLTLGNTTLPVLDSIRWATVETGTAENKLVPQAILPKSYRSIN